MVAVLGLSRSRFTAASRLSGRQQSSNTCVVCVVARFARGITSRAATAAATAVPPLAMRCASNPTTATYQVTPLAAVARHMHMRTRGFAAEAADEVEGEVEDEVETRVYEISATDTNSLRGEVHPYQEVQGTLRGAFSGRSAGLLPPRWSSSLVSSSRRVRGCRPFLRGCHEPKNR